MQEWNPRHISPRQPSTVLLRARSRQCGDMHLFPPVILRHRHSLGWMGSDSVHFSLTSSPKELLRRCCPGETALSPSLQTWGCSDRDQYHCQFRKEAASHVCEVVAAAVMSKERKPGKAPRQTSAPPLLQYICSAFLTF